MNRRSLTPYGSKEAEILASQSQSLLSQTEPDKEQRTVVTSGKMKWAAGKQAWENELLINQWSPNYWPDGEYFEVSWATYLCTFFPLQPFQNVKYILSSKAVQKPVLDCTSVVLMCLHYLMKYKPSKKTTSCSPNS